AATTEGLSDSSLSLVAVLFALAALVQSAQFPLHGWLLEVMETPTPVSALLHAGVINAGGFLLIRYSHLITLSPSAMNLLIAIGALTALFGSLVMMTQTSVKVSLAYSTIAQMGFMMLECGLGVFSAALLHIIAHSAYKAHAFLSSGETVRLAQPAKSLQPSPQGSAYGIIFATFISLLTVTLLGIYSGSNLITQPGPSTLSYIFALGLAIFLAHGFKGRMNFNFLTRIFVSVFGITILFFATQRLATLAFYDSLPSTSQNLSSVDLVVRVLLILLFSTLTMIPQIAPLNQNPRWLAFYIHLSHGFYINTFANRLAILFWPGAAPQSGPPTYIPNYNNGDDA
ncbi:MAG: hypothetical protein K2Q26_09090, partial [Bdellovibrionales bacterium]|nr:hypothetical protein [Bdellovibrionales bacterium]